MSRPHSGLTRAERAARIRANRLAEAREYLGGRCVRCGATKDLEFDHIEPENKVANLTVLALLRETFWAEVAKCQLLCIEHHREKTASERVPWKHGVYGFRAKKCRCDICASEHRAFQRERKARAKAVATT